MTKADYLNFDFMWHEWITVAALGTDALLPAADGASYHIGAYAEGADKSAWFNPRKTAISGGDATWNHNQIVYAFDEQTPAATPSGSIGTAVYFTGNVGVFDTLKLEVDSTILLGPQERKMSENLKYDDIKKVYDENKNRFDGQV